VGNGWGLRQFLKLHGRFRLLLWVDI